jgi:hypothetical protein
METTTLRTVATGALAALAVAVPVAHGATARTINLTERQTYFHETDNAPKGPSASDRITMGGVLLESGKRVGRDAVLCTGDRRCRATLTFANGTLLGAGMQTGGSFTVPVVGGTGTFAGAHGTIRVALTRGGSRYTIRLA